MNDLPPRTMDFIHTQSLEYIRFGERQRKQEIWWGGREREREGERGRERERERERVREREREREEKERERERSFIVVETFLCREERRTHFAQEPKYLSSGARGHLEGPQITATDKLAWLLPLCWGDSKPAAGTTS
jgi:hypothetical protein